MTPLDLDLEPAARVDLRGYVESAANLRESKKERVARVKGQRAQAFAVVLAALRTSRPVLSLPLTVLVTRVSPRKLDSDNLATAVKAQRDGATDALKQYLKDLKRPTPKDDSDRLIWLYDRARCTEGEEHLRLAFYETGCVAKWMLRYLPTEPSALERWVVQNAPRLDALLVREVG